MLNKLALKLDNSLSIEKHFFFNKKKKRDNNLDGVDLDYEDNEAMKAGTAVQWLIDCTIAIREKIPASEGYILTHAPQAPYFVGDAVYPDDAYLEVNRQVGHLIDWYNVQFYN